MGFFFTKTFPETEWYIDPKKKQILLAMQVSLVHLCSSYLAPGPLEIRFAFPQRENGLT